MRLKKLQAARAKWLQRQQATQHERSDYARQEAIRRFVIFVDGSLHGETADHDQAMHVQRLLRADGREERHRRSADGQPGDVG